MYHITYGLENSCNAVCALSHSLILATWAEHKLYSERALGFVLSMSSDSRKMPVVRLAEIGGIFWKLQEWGWPCKSRYWELISNRCFFCLVIGLRSPHFLLLPSPLLFFQSVKSVIELVIYLNNVLSELMENKSTYYANKLSWSISYEQRIFIYHISGNWEVPHQGAGGFSVWWGPTSYKNIFSLLS